MEYSQSISKRWGRWAGILGILVWNLPAGIPLRAAEQASIDSLYLEAQTTQKVETVREIVEKLKDALPDASDPDRMLVRIGRLHLRLREADSAIATFQQALEVNAKSAEAHTGLGRVHLELKDRPKEALPYLQAAIEADSTYAKGYYFLARAHQKSGKTAKARKVAAQAIKNNPGYAPPYLLLAQSYEKENNLKAAMIYYQKYLEQKPADQTAAYEFALGLLQDKKYKELEEISFRMAAEHGSPLYAQALLHKKDYESTLAMFRRYIDTLDPETQNLYENISLVGLPRETRAYQATTEERREAFLRNFWLRKDPFKTSGGAMRRAEHYCRVWHALTFYGKKKKPWDRRGDVYIRYGEPDYRSSSKLPNPKVPLRVQRIQEMMAQQLYGDAGLQASFSGPVFPIRTIRGGGSRDPSLEAGADDLGMRGWQPVTTTNDWSAVPWEVWVYDDVGNGIEIAFTDEFNSGNYNFAPIPYVRPGEEPPEGLLRFIQRITRFAPAAQMASVAATQPERYDFSELEPLNFYYQTLSFRGRNGKTDLQINIGLPIDNIALPTDHDTVVVVERRVALIGDRSTELQKLKQDMAIPISDRTRGGGRLAMSRFDLEADPGRYQLAVQASRQFTDITGVYQQQSFTLPNYNIDQLLLSDLQIAKRITEATQAVDSTFVRGNWNIMPWPPVTFFAVEPLFVYFEIYNLKLDDFGATRYEIAYKIQATAESGGSTLGAFLPRIRKRDGETIEVRYEQLGTEPSVYDYVELDLGQGNPGSYTLRMTVKDLNSNEEVSKTAKFKIAPPPR